jgi:hypothetical protein
MEGGGGEGDGGGGGDGEAGAACARASVSTGRACRSIFNTTRVKVCGRRSNQGAQISARDDFFL